MIRTAFAFAIILMGTVGSPLTSNSPAKTQQAKEPRKQSQAKSGANPFVQNPEWKRWKDRYASASPLLMLNKVWPKELSISDENIKLVLQRKTLIKFSQPLKLGERSYESFNLLTDEDALRFEPHDQIDLQLYFGTESEQALKEEERFRVMTDNMMVMTGSREADELILLSVGATHGIDLFFAAFLKDADKKKTTPFLKKKFEVMYTIPPYTDSTLGLPLEAHNFVQVASGIPEKPRTFGSASALWGSFFLSRLYYYQGLLRERLKLEDLKKDDGNLGTIVLMELHKYDNSANIDALPSAAALKLAGIKKVRFGNEGWKYGEKYSLEQLKEISLTPSQRLVQDFELEVIKEKHPKWYSRYQEGIVANPIGYAIYQKLKSWSDQGVKISITGLEEFDRMPIRK